MASHAFYRTDKPIAFFITFHTYGTWLHGDDRGSVDRVHNVFGTPFLPPDERRFNAEAHQRSGPGVVLTTDQRMVIDAAIREVCAVRGWPLHALNVRTNHVHVVATFDIDPERAMNQWKSWGTRRLREKGLYAGDGKLWARHGSTQYLWDEDALLAAKNYTINLQSERGRGGEG